MAQHSRVRSERVVAAVVCRDDRFLVCRRPGHKRHGGLWEFPGGKVVTDETDADAISRELREELGVALVHADIAEFEAADPQSPFLIAFVPARIDGEPACHEHSELRWATLDDLESLPLAPSDARYVEWRARRDGTRDVA